MIELNFEYIVDEKGVDRAYNYIVNKRYLGLDTETTGLDPHTDKIHCIQIGDQFKQFVFDYVRTKHYLNKIVSLFESDAIIWLGQHIKFDYKVIKSAFGVNLNHCIDTMLAEQLLTNGKKISAALDAIAKKYINEDLNKDIRSSFQDHSYGTPLNEIQIKYAARDVAVLIPIFSHQRNLLKRSNLLDVFNLECDAISPTAEMEFNGIYLNSKKWNALYNQSLEEAELAKLELDKYFLPHCHTDLFGNPIINYNSPVQIIPVLEKISNLKIQNSGKDTIKKLENYHEVFKVLLNYREATKRYTTYGPEFLKHINKKTNRIHSSYAQLRSEQGRYASSEPNMQNIPAKISFRSCFEPEDLYNYLMYTADYSGCELRLLAELSGDKKFREIFIKNQDPHKAVASYLTGKPYESISDEDRKPYKAVNFGVIYGQGPLKLSQTLDINIDRAKEMISSYYTTFPGVRDFLQDMADRAERTKTAYSPLDGRKRDMSNLDWDDPRSVGHARNVAKNMPFQGGNASMIKRAMIILNKKIKQYNRTDLKLVACVHDEFVSEGLRNKLEEGKNIIVDSMKEAGEYYVKSVPILVNVDVADHWVK